MTSLMELLGSVNAIEPTRTYTINNKIKKK